MPRPITLCATENVGAGCGRDFPQKTKSGLCVACEAINGVEGKEREKKEMISSLLSHGLNFFIDRFDSAGVSTSPVELFGSGFHTLTSVEHVTLMVSTYDFWFSVILRYLQQMLTARP